MVFSEPIFLFLFLPLALVCIFAAISFGRGHALTIFLSSLVFYYWSSGLFVLMLLGCVLANWAIAQRLEYDHRHRWLVLGLTANLGTLAYFKYAYFFTSNWDAVLGTEAALRFAHLALPVGISFFSFQGVSYLIDVWRGDTRAEPNFIVFGAYLTFFPQLIAGPIVRYRDVAHEYHRPAPSWQRASYGVSRFTHGLVKKVLVADTAAPVADACFGLGGDELTLLSAWIGALAYSIQIYFDFSGYSDMAIGLAALCGISLHENFERPYASSTLTEFWRRWHISLSSWFRDYLYIPLGGNRVGPIRLYANLFLVFAATGFWHGAAWNFVAWGAYHGLFLVLERLLVHRERLAQAGLRARLIYMLPATVFGWVLFRAESLPSAYLYWQAMLIPRSLEGGLLSEQLLRALTPMTAIVLSVSLLSFAMPREPTAAQWFGRAGSNTLPWVQFGYILLGLAACGMIVLTSDFSPFLYFRF
jgi:alginate O-acetyltransferase complex protein AlgI